MPDVLSQSEVDNLLNGVDTSPAAASAAPIAAGPASSKRSRVGTGLSKTPVKFEVYDFKRPERVSTDQMSSIAMMHDVVARKLGASLSAYLRTIVDVKLTETEQLTYNEFLMSIPPQTCFNVLSCDPLDGQIVLEINPAIVFPIIDKLLGGGGGGAIPDREMTDIEWRLIKFLRDETLKYLREAWEPILEIDFKLDTYDTNPMIQQIVPPNEVVIIMTFEIKMGESSGMINLCIPFPVIEPKMGEFSTIQTWFQARRTADAKIENQKLNEGIKDAPIEAVAYVARTQMTLKQLLKLKTGDLLLTDRDVTEPILFKIAGKPKFWAEGGQHRKFKAIQIKQKAEIDDDL